MGTNAWPALPALAEAVKRQSLPVGVAAASVLARIKADEHPGWADVQKGLKDQDNAFSAFRHLIKGSDRFGRRYDLAHRRFGLVGVAAVGMVASQAILDLVAIVQSKEDHELWFPAVIALGRIGGEAKEFVPPLKRVLQDSEEWPQVRAAAIQALAAVTPEDAETRLLLHQAREDERAQVRVAAGESAMESEISIGRSAAYVDLTLDSQTRLDPNNGTKWVGRNGQFCRAEQCSYRAPDVR